jgi:putative ABC transport system substrate-binding protein
MNRREVMVVLGAAVALPVAARSQATGGGPVVAWVANETANPERLAVFKKGLSELNYQEGKNLKIEYRNAKLDGEYDAIVGELVALKVNIIVASNAPAAVAAYKATHTIPIVLGAVNDPVGLGLVKSLEHPSTNVTGTTMYAPHLIGERLRTLQKIVPALRKVSMVTNGNIANNAAQFLRLQAEAKSLGIETQQLDIRNSADLEPEFRKARRYGVDGMLNAVDSFVNSQRFAMAKLAARDKLPVIYSDREYVLAGGLMAIGPGHQEGFYGAAKYVDMILRGANPGELPVAPTKSVDVSVSRSALDRIGLVLPKDVSDRVNDWLD